jgi:hypothetical protein
MCSTVTLLAGFGVCFYIFVYRKIRNTPTDELKAYVEVLNGEIKDRGENLKEAEGE